ncbi:beta-carotene ketolase [Sphingomonas piscis]|uniref:Beta-carotene ketolase n=2 Tax=Sphingomonas piscis TaxID=2714943 RepID=A0A6G7YTN6_9SPHN|nr:beta-carotene ketolase [Sphingomonas piscis]
MIIGGWLALHIWSVFFLPLTRGTYVAAPLIVALICWLNVGMFIVAHDAMHGSLAPGRPALNRWVGRMALLLYAGFWYDRLIAEHMSHHREPGTAGDPDFSVDHSTSFWPWFVTFFRHYFGWQQMAFLTALTIAYLLLGASYANILLFWALPAILSALQLFYFGTYRPHRQEAHPFADRHNARTNDFGWLASLLSCFHFGYHHEHHLAPHVPWWRLPAERRRSLSR